MTPSIFQTFRVNRASIWKSDFSIESANGRLATVDYLNALQTEAKVQTQNKAFFIEKGVMGGEISVYDNETNEEIALLEVEMSFSHIKYVMRFRYKEDKYTFSHKHLWKTSEFEWRNEAEQELMRIQQKWNWFKQETVMEVNTQLVPEDEVALLSVLGIMVIQYYNSGQGT